MAYYNLHGLTLRILKKKNSRPYFLKDHLRQSKVNSRFLGKYEEILIYKWKDKPNLNIIYVQVLFCWEKDLYNEKQI